MTENAVLKFDRKASILEVAERQVAGVGHSSVSIRSIAREAGCTSGVLYYHFADLDEVLIAVNSRTIAMLDAELLAAAAGDGAIGVLFERLALAYLRFAAAHPRRFAALFEHRMANGVPLPAAHVEEHQALFRHVEKPMAAIPATGSEAERKTMARSIFSAVHGIVQLGLQGQLLALPLPVLEQQVAAVTRILAAGLRTAPGAA